MTAARVSEHWLRRQSSVLYPWRVSRARCILREWCSFEVVSIDRFTNFITIDPSTPTGRTTRGGGGQDIRGSNSPH